MARSLGDFGVRREPLDLDFGYFGARIRVHPAASDTVELEFLDVGRDIDLDDLRDRDLSDLDEDARLAVLGAMSRAVRQGYLLIKGSLQAVIHPDDWPTYWQLAKDNGQRISDLMTDLKRITAAVVEADTGFPTMPPSGSDGGRETTPLKSGDVSSSDADRALAMLRGRPDLQEFVVMQEEADAERAAAVARMASGGQTAASKMMATMRQG